MLVILPRVHFKQTKLIQVIETTIYEGEGTTECPGRYVVYYTDLEGKLLAKNDPDIGEVKKPDLGTLTTNTEVQKCIICGQDCGLVNICINNSILATNLP